MGWPDLYSMLETCQVNSKKEDVKELGDPNRGPHVSMSSRSPRVNSPLHQRSVNSVCESRSWSCRDALRTTGFGKQPILPLLFTTSTSGILPGLAPLLESSGFSSGMPHQAGSGC
uniref:Uncharacterized protein n=1 Tax=Grammatophora oceanica TaxID=210454 RepID=A0A6U5KFR0_9STRA|mmetsp:Transcript_29191/g.43011  ORF Transcript_29191/g.43011 Transcript_29191/m.43011 type:complete len:115 (+) Transcript_29191:356-700(+)